MKRISVVRPNIENDIKELERKNRVLMTKYPSSFSEIARKYGVSLQYVFILRSKMIAKKGLKVLRVKDR